MSRPPVAIRTLHALQSPFLPLVGKSPLSSPPAVRTVSHLEKQSDHTSEPSESPLYVVSDSPQENFHGVPAGAFPTSAPYVNFPETDPPDTEGAQVSSTSSDLLAHPQTTRGVPQHEGGVGSSSAVRHREAPGQMGAQGGSDGGLGLMDEKGTLKKP